MTISSQHSEQNGWIKVTKADVGHLCNAFEDEYYNQIIEKLPVFDNSRQLSCKTKEVKTKIAVIGNKSFDVYGHGLDNKVAAQEHFANREWMFDLIWYTEPKDKTFFIRSLELALECEWGKKRLLTTNTNDDPYGEMKYDFQKLVVCNAKRRIMIFKQRSKDKDLSIITKDIESQLSMYKELETGSDVLCIAYGYAYKSFRYRLFTKQ